MNLRFLFSFVLCFFLHYSYADDLISIIKNSPSQYSYPEEDSLILQEVKEITLLPDGRVKKYVQIVRKLFTDFAVDTFCDPRILFNSKTQKLNVITARTFRADLTPVDTEENGKNLSTPFNLEKAPDYLHFQEMVVTHVGVERGAITHLEYEIEDLIPFREVFEGEEGFYKSEPVVEKIFIINIPAGTELKYQLSGEGSQKILNPPAFSQKINWKTYRWKVNNLPSKNFLEDDLKYFATLYWTTTKDLKSLVKNFSDNLQSLSLPSPVVINKSEEIIKTKASTISKVISIYEFVDSNIISIDWKENEISSGMRDAEEVLKSGYGTKLDKTILLHSMLEAVKIKSEIVMFSPYINLPSRLPLLFPFNKFLISFKGEDGKEIFIDPSQIYEENKKWALGGGTLVRLHKGEIIPETRIPENQKIEIIGEMYVDEKHNIKGNLSFLLSGRFNPYLKISKGEKEFNSFIENLITKIFNGVNIEGKNIININPDLINFSVQFKLKPENERDIYFINISKLDLISQNFRENIKRLKKETPLNILSPLNENISIKIKFARGFKIFIKPLIETLSTDIGNGELIITKEDNTIFLERKLIINRYLILPQQYDKFRSLFLSSMGGNYFSIVYKKIVQK